jgi:DNA-binding beta-propeller fold protein YncE
MPRLATLTCCLALALGAAAPVASAAPAVRVDYIYVGSIDLGAPGGWDYASFDSAGGRLYVGHTDKVTVVDADAGKMLGDIGPINGAHGAAIDHALGVGFATSGHDGLLKEFNLADLKLIKDIPVGEDADGVIFDASTDSAILTVGDGKQIVIVDAKAATVTRKIDLPGEPEFLAADGAGKLFVNLASTGQLAKIDIASGHVDAVWTLDGCKSPHGLGYDHHTRRLFSGCANKVLVAVDPASGKVVASLPVGPFNDAVVVDEKRGRVFCPNGDGTLTVIGEEPGDHDVVLRTIPTFLGARSMAIDPRSGELYITYGDTQIVSGPRDPGGIKFGWAGAKVAVFTPAD